VGEDEIFRRDCDSKCGPVQTTKTHVNGVSIPERRGELNVNIGSGQLWPYITPCIEFVQSVRLRAVYV
jgi:hypothetical protein